MYEFGNLGVSWLDRLLRETKKNSFNAKHYLAYSSAESAVVGGQEWFKTNFVLPTLID